ncbi:MAG: ATP-binding protein [Microcoleaceae cyanobacterium]
MSLAKLLFEKTNGNPFFLTQLLKSLYEEELIWFDMEARKWRWALGRIQQEGVTDNVVELMISRIGQLPETTQRALQVAANIGNQFDLKTLAVAAERSVQGIGQNLWPAIREGLIIPTTEAYKAYQTAVEIQHSIPDARECTYRFLHDRVQQAAYELIPEEQKQITHYRIGQLLFKNSSEIERYERIFEIVNHLNHGATLVNAQAERNQLAQLNLIAGQKAKAIAAYSTACNYFVAGLRIAEENSWQTQYELTLSLHYGWTEVLYLLGEFEQMRSASSIVIQNSSNLIDKIPVYLTQISAYQGQGEGLKALELGLQVLELLGIKLPDKPAKQDISQAMEKTILLFENKNREELIYADETHNPKVIASQKILSIMMGCTYLEAPMFLPLIICEQARLSICFGKTDLAAQIYGNYGMLLCSSVSSIESGNKAGEIALELFKESTEQNSKACVYNLIYSYIRPWKYSLRASLEPLKNSFNSGLGTGETEYASYAICHYCMFLFLSGETLDQVEKEISIYKKAVKEVHQVTMYNLLGVIYQSIIPLMNANDSPTRMNEKVDHKLDVDISQELELKDGISFCILYINKLVLSYLSGEIESAIHFSQEANQYLDYIPAEIYNSTFHFYRALTYLADDTVPSPDGDCFTTELIESFNKTKYFAIHAPMNHQHKVDLVEAEKCRVLGQKAEAIERYDKAIAGAKENEYIQEEALANELAAKFYLEWGKEKIAQAYLIEAYYCYGRWGTAAKTTQLEQQYPELLSPILQQKRVGLDSFQTQTTTGRIHQNTSQYVASSSSISHLLDLTSVMKASQVLSGEIELEKLLTKLMRVILENAGATKGVLLMNRDQTLSVEVIATQSSEWGISINQQTLLTIESLDIPLKLINLVKRQLEPIIVDDVLNHAECASDPYLIQQQPKSLLCLPILSHGELLAILYLENQLITQAFTNERVEILKLLCSQAAISLENAELYQKSQNYAHQLEQSLTQLQEAQVQLVQSEKMSALGQMMSGITHEINNPLGFVAGNIGQVEEALQDVFEYLELYQKYHPPGEEVTAYAEEIELEYVLEDLPEMVTSMKTGINRIKEISKSMRIFSRADQEKTVGFNLHEGLDSTLLILRHRLKATEKRPEIQVIKEYGDLPQVNGFPGQLNQVFMNILANAADVFDEMSTERSIDEMKPHSYQITLKTKLDSDNQMVVVRIQDNGGGMPEETKAKIFEHLFTTKAVGKGTGLGLSIARQIVVDKHHGKLECYSTLGQGTEFIIQLPT